MCRASTSPTLYEDWLARRNRLAGLRDPGGTYAMIELRLLDYLLRRFRDAPEAKRPAMFPLASTLVINQRAAVIHSHLAKGHHVADARQARDRVTSILQRMASPTRREAEVEDFEFVPNSRIGRLCDRSRASLGSGGRRKRLRAINILGRWGNLDDFGLLGDLAALPPQDDEHPHERAALSHAMQRIAGLTTSAFDIARYAATSNPLEQSWDCLKCGTCVPNVFDVCPACGASSDGVRRVRE
jgi:hypothetical protein